MILTDGGQVQKSGLLNAWSSIFTQLVSFIQVKQNNFSITVFGVESLILWAHSDLMEKYSSNFLLLWNIKKKLQEQKEEGS